MKILLTGATGFLGRYVRKELHNQQIDTVLFSRREPEKEADNFAWVQGDFNNLEDCIRAMQSDKFDAIMHVAAIPAPTDIPNTPEFEDVKNAPMCMHSNVVGLYNMLSAALRTNVKTFIQTGSNCVMGHERRVTAGLPPLQYLPIDELHPGDPQDSYSVSKACGEILLKSFCAYGMHTYSLRCGWLLDEDMRKMIAEQRSSTPTTALRDVFNAYMAVEDCAKAHVMLLTEALKGNLLAHDVFYLNGDDSLAPEPTMELLEKFRPDIIPLLKEPLPGFRGFFSNEKFKRAVGWQPRYSWRDHL